MPKGESRYRSSYDPEKRVYHCAVCGGDYKDAKEKQWW